MPAGSAKRERRVAAAIEEQHRLLAAAPRLLDAGDRARREPPAARRAFAPEVDEGDVGQPRRAEACGEAEPAVASALGVEAGLDRRRRGSEHDRRLLEPRPHDRHVARVVDDAFLLLVGALVLLIDDDEAEVGERQKQSRARADNHPRLAARRRRPDPFALALRQPGVPFGRSRAEAAAEPIEKLRGQRDLRQEHERLASLPQRFGDRLEIDLGLARSSHALEQRGRERAVGDAPLKIISRGALVGVEQRRAEVRVERRRALLRRERDSGERAVGDEAVDDACGAARPRGEHAALGVGAPLSASAARTRARASVMRVGALAGGDEAEFRRGRRRDLAGADRHAQATCRVALTSNEPPNR